MDADTKRLLEPALSKIVEHFTSQIQQLEKRVELAELNVATEAERVRAELHDEHEKAVAEMRREHAAAILERDDAAPAARGSGVRVRAGGGSFVPRPAAPRQSLT